MRRAATSRHPAVVRRAAQWGAPAVDGDTTKPLGRPYELAGLPDVVLVGKGVNVGVDVLTTHER
jgi:hypothetical protein